MSGISGLNAYYRFQGGGSYGGSYGIAAAVRTAKANGQIASYGAKKSATPEAPVDRVRPVSSVSPDSAAPATRTLPTWSQNAAEEAVRMRIQYAENMPQTPSERASLLLNNTAKDPMNLPETAWEGLPNYPGVDAAEAAVRMRIQLPGADNADEAAQPVGLDGKPITDDKPVGLDGKPITDDKTVGLDGKPIDADDASSGVEGVQKAAEEGRCETCEQRKYQDGSDDMSVSFQTPTRIAPENVASAVRGHEMEHVSHEQAKAQQEGRKVVSQTVTLHTDICPECGKTYISGGTTRTVTAAKPEQPAAEPKQEEQKLPSGIA